MAGSGGERIETQAFVAPGEAVAVAYDPNVVVNRERVTVVPIAGSLAARNVQVAVLRGDPEPATRACSMCCATWAGRHTRQLARSRAGA